MLFNTLQAPGLFGTGSYIAAWGFRDLPQQREAAHHGRLAEVAAMAVACCFAGLAGGFLKGPFAQLKMLLGKI